MVKRDDSPIFSTHLEYCVQFLATQCENDATILENIHRRAVLLVKGAEGMFYEERLRTLELYCMMKRNIGVTPFPSAAPLGGEMEKEVSISSTIFDSMPCHAIPCHAMPFHAMPCHSMPFHSILRYSILCSDIEKSIIDNHLDKFIMKQS